MRNYRWQSRRRPRGQPLPVISGPLDGGQNTELPIPGPPLEIAFTLVQMFQY